MYNKVEYKVMFVIFCAGPGRCQLRKRMNEDEERLVPVGVLMYICI